MRSVTAAWVAAAVGGDLRADPGLVITGVVRDSRDASPGSLFVAIQGERVDGHDFVVAAAEAGAVLHLVSRPVDAPHVLVTDTVTALGELARAYLADLRASSPLIVVGITGSVGKTTTKDLLAQILPNVVAPQGSYNNEIGLPLTVLLADATTRHLVLEMGASGRGHIAYLTRIAPPDIAAVLVVGSAHLGEYGSIDDLARAKAEIIEGRAVGGKAILNADDPRVAPMATLAPGATTFGVSTGDVHTEGLVSERARASFDLVAGADRARVTLRLIGEHHVTNALAAAAIALACGMSLDDVAARLSSAVPASPHRMAVTERTDGVTILDDAYNASPESMQAALRALREVAGAGRAVAVIGAMRELGESSAAAHDRVGALAVRLGIDLLLVVGEGARAAYDSAVREGSFGGEAAFVSTIPEARAFLDDNLRSGDTVLVKASNGSDLWKLADALVGVAS